MKDFNEVYSFDSCHIRLDQISKAGSNQHTSSLINYHRAFIKRTFFMDSKEFYTEFYNA